MPSAAPKSAFSCPAANGIRQWTWRIVPVSIGQRCTVQRSIRVLRIPEGGRACGPVIRTEQHAAHQTGNRPLGFRTETSAPPAARPVSAGSIWPTIDTQSAPVPQSPAFTVTRARAALGPGPDPAEPRSPQSAKGPLGPDSHLRPGPLPTAEDLRPPSGPRDPSINPARRSPFRPASTIGQGTGSAQALCDRT